MDTREIAEMVEENIFKYFNNNKYLVNDTPKINWLNNWIREDFIRTFNPNIMKQFKIDKTIRSEDSKKLIEITMNAIKSCVKKQIRIIFYNMFSHYIQKNKLARLNKTQITQDNFFKTLKDRRKKLKNTKKLRIILDRKSKKKIRGLEKFWY